MSGHASGKRGLSWQLAAAIVLALITLGLGVWGWLEEGEHLEDAVYRSLAAFHASEFYGDGDEHPLNLQLEIARFTGIGAFVFAAIGTFLGFVSEGVSRLKARIFNPDIVVVGSHEIAYAAVKHIEEKEKNRRVTHIGSEKFQSRRKVISLPWADSARKDLMIPTHIKGARHVLVVEQEESEALHLARLINDADGKANISAIIRHSRLANDAALRWSDHNFRIITSSALSVRALHRGHPPFLTAIDRKQERIHAVIIGFGHMGEAVARDICINCLVSGLGKPRLTVIDPQVTEREAALRLRTPELDEICDFVARPGAFGNGRQPPEGLEANAPPITCAYFCLPDDNVSLGALGGVAAWLRAEKAEKSPLYMRLRNKDMLPSGPEAVTVFGDHEALLAESDFCNDGVDRHAREYHEAYLATLPPEKQWHADAPGKNEAARPWDRLKETYRISNRFVVEHLPAKIASAGLAKDRWLNCDCIPDLSDDQIDLTSDSSLFEQMSELEHERFNAERRWNGWRYAPARDNARLEHDCLVPFNKLDKETQDYDRKFVRQTQDILNRASGSESKRKKR